MYMLVIEEARLIIDSLIRAELEELEAGSE